MKNAQFSLDSTSLELSDSIIEAYKTILIATIAETPPASLRMHLLTTFEETTFSRAALLAANVADKLLQGAVKSNDHMRTQQIAYDWASIHSFTSHTNSPTAIGQLVSATGSTLWNAALSQALDQHLPVSIKPLFVQPYDEELQEFKLALANLETACKKEGIDPHSTKNSLFVNLYGLARAYRELHDELRPTAESGASRPLDKRSATFATSVPV